MSHSFVKRLSDYRAQAVFNPWGETDPQNDLHPQGTLIRQRQLHQYLQERIGRADTLLCAEAIGYQGGHFSGIPMTSERLLLGGLRHKNLIPEMVFSGLTAERTSRPSVRPTGFTEPTATIVWGFFAERGIDPYRVVLWNAFPWHPYHPDKGLLSNRTPTEAELCVGHQMLINLLELGQFRQIVAIGEKAFAQLQGLGVRSTKVRHPANGGAGQFRAQLRNCLR